MKFHIGKVIQWGKDSVLEINFPGIGVIRAEETSDGFECITLNRDQLKKLKRQIHKELEKIDGKKSYME